MVPRPPRCPTDDKLDGVARFLKSRMPRNGDPTRIETFGGPCVYSLFACRGLAFLGLPFAECCSRALLLDMETFTYGQLGLSREV